MLIDKFSEKRKSIKLNIKCRATVSSSTELYSQLHQIETMIITIIKGITIIIVTVAFENFTNWRNNYIYIGWHRLNK